MEDVGQWRGTERCQDIYHCFCILFLPSQSHSKAGTAPDAPLSTPFTDVIVLPKTPQEDDYSSLPTSKHFKKLTEFSREGADNTKEDLREKGDGSLQFSYFMEKVQALQLNFADSSV